MYSLNKCYFAFNIWDFDSAQAVIDAAAVCGCGVILQTSSRIFEAMEQEAIRSFVTCYGNKTGVKVYLHLDHCRKPEVIRQAVDIGWDSVMIDASALPLEENIAMTNVVCEYAHKRGALVEAEVGQIRGVEEDVVSDSEGVADIGEIERFIAAANMDMFAAAIGTCHGIYRKEPHIRHDMIEQIGHLTDKPFVVHGGSGLADGELRRLLAHDNVRKINISTELKQAYREGIMRAGVSGLMQSSAFEVTAVKKEIYEAIRAVAEHKMSLLDQ